MNVEEVPLKRLVLGDRLRHIDESYAALMAGSIQASGQQSPMYVRPLVNSDLLEVVVGGHRWRALHLAGKDTALVVVIEATDEEALLMEIDENLCRRELNPLDRAVFLAKRKVVYEALHPETKHGGDRKSAARNQAREFADLLSFTQATAEKIGLSRSQIEKAVALTKRIAPDVLPTIKTTWLADSGHQLEIFSKLPLDQQRDLAKALTNFPSVRTVPDLHAAVHGREGREPAGVLQKFMSLWDKADNAEKDAIREHIAADTKSGRRKRAA